MTSNSPASSVWFLAYLWGIETRTRYVDGFSQAAFLAYLWGIETGFGLFFCPLNGKFLAYLWGIETVLCKKPPLVPGRVLSLPMRNWNKPRMDTKQLRLMVLSLPMRNWNHLSGDCKNHSLRQFLAYLWGIETKVVFVFDVSQTRVLSLPMRNWNCSWFPGSWIRDSVLSLPMRNWNGITSDKIKRVNASS